MYCFSRGYAAFIAVNYSQSCVSSGSQFPKLADAKNSTLKAVGLEYEDDGFVLSDGDEVSFFPPVQGG